MRLKRKYLLGRVYKGTKSVKRGGDNPQSNPSVAKRNRLGMTPRKAWGQGLEGRQGK